MDCTVMAENRVKIKENENIHKYSEKKTLKKNLENKVDGDTSCNWKISKGGSNRKSNEESRPSRLQHC